MDTITETEKNEVMEIRRIEKLIQDYQLNKKPSDHKGSSPKADKINFNSKKWQHT